MPAMRSVAIWGSRACVDRSLRQSECLDRSVRRPTCNREDVRFHGANRFELPPSILDGAINRGCIWGGISDGNGHDASARGGLDDA